MATTLVATAGASTANSYVTVAEADAYFEEHPEYATWDTLATVDKERRLIAATRMIDRLSLDGGKYDTDLTSGVPDQALHFPRAQDYDDGAVFVPIEAKHATYEQALFLEKVGGPKSTRQLLQAQGVTSVTVGDVSESYSESSGFNAGIGRDAYQILLAAGLLSLSAGSAL